MLTTKTICGEKMTNIIDADLILELQDRFGDVYAQSILDQLTRFPCRDDDPQCLEVLQMSEIAHRLRHHLREKIRECRELEAQARLHENELFYLNRELHMRQRQIMTRDADGKTVDGLYALYKGAWSDFLWMFDVYMAKLKKSPKESRILKERAASRGRFIAMQKEYNKLSHERYSSFSKVVNASGVSKGRAVL